MSEKVELESVTEIAPADPPAEYRPPKRLTPSRRGQRFTPHNTDSVGEIVSDPRRNRRSVQFRYEHNPDVVWSMDAHEFNDRFARLLDDVSRKRKRRFPAALIPQKRAA